MIGGVFAGSVSGPRGAIVVDGLAGVAGANLGGNIGAYSAGRGTAEAWRQWHVGGVQASGPAPTDLYGGPR